MVTDFFKLARAVGAFPNEAGGGTALYAPDEIKKIKVLNSLNLDKQKARDIIAMIKEIRVHVPVASSLFCA